MKTDPDREAAQFQTLMRFAELAAKRVGKPSTLDTDPDVRRKAKSAL